MNKLYTTRRKTLDTMCQITSILCERVDREESGFSNTIGGRSRGVLIVGGQFSEALEKGVVLCRKDVSHGTEKKCRKATQVGWPARRYDDDAGEKKMLTRAACETGWSRVKSWKKAGKTTGEKFSQKGGTRIDVSGCADRRLRLF